MFTPFNEFTDSRVESRPSFADRKNTIMSAQFKTRFQKKNQQ